jgi:hypothetical protein
MSSNAIHSEPAIAFESDFREAADWPKDCRKQDFANHCSIHVVKLAAVTIVIADVDIYLRQLVTSVM